jgi:hypothetical protein
MERQMSEELKACQTVELLPCPFCGGQATLVNSNPSRNLFRVQCQNNCAVHPASDWHSGASKAITIAAWNKRAPLPSDPPNVAGKGFLEEIVSIAKRAIGCIEGTDPQHANELMSCLRLALSGNAGGERPVQKTEWEFCPECGSERCEHGIDLEKSHRYCLDCGQEWFTDNDYLRVVKANLAVLFASKKAASQREKLIKRLTPAIRYPIMIGEVVAKEMLACIAALAHVEGELLSLRVAISNQIEITKDVVNQKNELRAKRDALVKFKTFVHAYLDQHGIPHGDPENQHQKDGCRIGARLDLLLNERDALRTQVAELEKRKDDVYLERNKLVAALAKLFPSGLSRTAIEGWSDDWHGCVYIDLPTGQVSWHYHDSQAGLFEGLPLYSKPWDGHTTEEKYRRLAAMQKAVEGDGELAENVRRIKGNFDQTWPGHMTRKSIVTEAAFLLFDNIPAILAASANAKLIYEAAALLKEAVQSGCVFNGKIDDFLRRVPSLSPTPRDEGRGER